MFRWFNSFLQNSDILDKTTIPPPSFKLINELPNNPPLGIPNRSGTTCFLNALLQALASSLAVQNHLVSFISNPNLNTSTSSLLLQTLRHLLSSTTPSSPILDITPLEKQLKRSFPQLFNGVHQDAQEILTLLVDILEKEQNATPFRRKTSTLVLLDETPSSSSASSSSFSSQFTPLLGFTSTSLKCTVCESLSPLQLQSFNSITIYPNPSHPTNQLSQMLPKLFKGPGEMVNGVECTKCWVLSLLQENEADLSRLSSFITQNENEIDAEDDEDIRIRKYVGELRSQSLQFTNTLSVFDSLVDPFPPTLHPPTLPRQTMLKSEHLLRSGKLLIFHINRALLQGSQKDQTKVSFTEYLNVAPLLLNHSSSNSHLYKLISVIEHRGGTRYCGHFVAYTRRNDLWYECNDSSVTQVPLDFVLRAPQAYLLFYEKQV